QRGILLRRSRAREGQTQKDCENYRRAACIEFFDHGRTPPKTHFPAHVARNAQQHIPTSELVKRKPASDQGNSTWPSAGTRGETEPEKSRGPGAAPRTSLRGGGSFRRY